MHSSGAASSPAPRVETFALGPWETNCYVISLDGSPDCWIIDVGFDPAPMIEAIQRTRLRPIRIILTHAHLDHIAGAREVIAAFGQIPIAIHQAEADWLGDPTLNLSAFLEMNVTAPPASELLHDGDTLELGASRWRILHTPGHSPGGITLVNDESRTAIVGDTLFAGSIGRHDFPTSDGRQLLRSISTRLMTLPDDTRVLPGHGPATTIGHERRSNPFLVGAMSA